MKGHLTAFAGFGLIAAALGSAAPPATAVERNQPKYVIPLKRTPNLDLLLLTP